MLLPRMNRSAAAKSAISSFLIVTLLLGVGSCARRSRTVDKLAQESSKAEEFDGSLAFNDVTLEQANEEGQLWWRVKAKRATYSNDQKLAKVETPKGELFQDGKAVFKISAKTGEVQQDGKKILLREQIVAIDTRDGLVLRGNELEWRPEEDLLIVRNNLTGTRKQVQARATEARALTRKRQVEFTGKVVAVSQDPALQMTTEKLTWLVPQEKLISDRSVQIDRYVGKTPVDRATGNQGEVNLKTKVATLRQNAQISLTDPPLQIAGNSMLWNTNTQIVTADQSVSVLHRQQRVTLTANQGQMNLKQKIVTLAGNVQGIGQRNQSQLTANNLTWYIPTESFVASGNVVYRQAKPRFNLTGPQASGKLRDETVVVSGGRVVTEIIP
jgi:LPS export ABC transporter protein LptC